MSARLPHWLSVALAGTAALIVVHGIGRFAFTPLVPVMTEQAGLSLAGAAWLASANYLAYLLGSLFTFWRHGAEERERWLRRGLWLNVGTTFAMGLIDHFPSWALLRLVNGFSNGLVFVYAPALVLEVLARNGRGVWSGLTFTGVGVGICLSSLPVSLGYALGLRWDGLWLGLGLLALPLAWWATRTLRLAPAEPTPAGDAGAPAVRGPLSADFAWLAAGYTTAGFGYIISMTFLPVIIAALPDLDGWVGPSWLLVGAAAIPSTFLWSWLGQRFGDFPALLAAFAAQAIGVALPVLWISAAGTVLGALLLGGTFVGIVQLTMRIARNRWPQQAGRLIGLLVTLYGIAQMIGPLVAEWTRRLTGSYTAGLLLASATLALGMLFMRLAWRAQWHPAATAARTSRTEPT